MMNSTAPKAYIIKGDPIPLARARHAHRRTYDDQKQLKSMLRVSLESQHGDRPLYEGPLKFEATFYFGFPEKMSQAKKDKLAGKPHIFRPDISNLQKLIEDVASGILYHDDCLICISVVYKVYDHIPRTEFTITEMK